MKLSFKAIFVFSVAFSLLFFNGCQKGQEKNEQRPSNVAPAEIPSPDTERPENKPPSTAHREQEPNRAEESSDTNGLSPAPIKKEQQAAKAVVSKAVPRISVKLQFNTHGSTIPEPIKVKYENKILGKTLDGQLKLRLKEDYLDKNLAIEAPYFKPVPPVTVTENATEFNINLEPLMVKIKVADSMGIYADKVDNVQILANDKLIGKTDKQGVAEVRAAHTGLNNYIFYKPHVFSRQAHVVKIDGKNAVVRVALLPLKHFIRIKLLDDKNRPLANREVELSGNGLALNERTARNGIVKLRSFRLKPATKYQIHIRSMDYTNNEFTFSNEYFDASRKYIAVKIPAKYQWSIRTTAKDALITLYDYNGRKVSEGKEPLNVKISRGTYKIVAKSGTTTKKELINADDPMRNKIIIMNECYPYAQEWQKNHPGENNFPDEIINCLEEIPTSDANFINSRLLLAKAAMATKQYGSAKTYYEDILRFDRKKKYDPVILYNTAQAIIFFSDQIRKGQDKLQLLEQASSDYLDNASAYIGKLPIRSRKKWIIKIEYLKGELYQRLLFYYKKIDSYESARQNGNAALDAFNSFIRDYNSLSPSSSLKQSLRKDYERAIDLTGSIKAALTM